MVYQDFFWLKTESWVYLWTEVRAKHDALQIYFFTHDQNAVKSQLESSISKLRPMEASLDRLTDRRSDAAQELVLRIKEERNLLHNLRMRTQPYGFINTERLQNVSATDARLENEVRLMFDNVTIFLRAQNRQKRDELLHHLSRVELGRSISSATACVSSGSKWCRDKRIPLSVKTSILTTSWFPDIKTNNEEQEHDYTSLSLLHERVSGPIRKAVYDVRIAMSLIESIKPQARKIAVAHFDNKMLLEVPKQLWEDPMYEGKLESVYLENNFLRALPEQMKALKTLRLLCVAKNRLINIPAWIGDLEQLETLGFSMNQIHEIPVELGKLEFLSHLNVYENKISLLPVSLGKCQLLDTILVGKNPLKIHTEMEKENFDPLVGLPPGLLDSLPFGKTKDVCFAIVSFLRSRMNTRFRHLTTPAHCDRYIGRERYERYAKELARIKQEEEAARRLEEDRKDSTKRRLFFFSATPQERIQVLQGNEKNQTQESLQDFSNVKSN